MKALEIIKNLCFTVENQLSFVCRDLTEEDFHTRPSNNATAIGWTVGHVLISLEFIVHQSILGLPKVLTDEFLETFQTFSSGNIPVEISGQHLLQQFKELNSNVVKEILSKEENWLDQHPVKTDNFPPNWLNKNNMKVLVLFFNHAITHCGQIIETRRLLGKETWGV